MSDLEVTAVDVSGDLSAPVCVRYPAALLERVDALAAAAPTGIGRSVILRMACENGLSAVEAIFAAISPGAPADGV